MKITHCLKARQSISQAMILFILNNTGYDITDIATLIRQPQSLLESLLQGESSLDRKAEINLIRLYILALDLNTPLTIEWK